MSKLCNVGLFVVILLLGSSCSRGFDPQIHSADYDRLKESLQRLIDLRSSEFSDIANNLNFDIQSNTNIWTFPDGSFAGKSYDSEFFKPIDEFANEIGFQDAEATHYWICEIGKSVAGLRAEFNPTDHFAFLKDVTNQILDDLNIPDYLQSEAGISCYVFFEQTAYVRYKDFAIKDKEGETRRSIENNMEAIYGEGSAIHLLSKMIMTLTAIS